MSTAGWAKVGTAGLAILLALVLFGGCGDDGDSSSSAESSATTDALLDGEGYETPSPGPVASSGKRVWVLSCNQATTNCSVAANAAMEAGEELGWDMTLYDVKFDPTRAVQGVRQAIADKADGIVTYLADCDSFRQALTEARQSDVKTSSAESLDCDPPLYDAIVDYTQGPYPKWLREWGAAQSATAINGADGDAKVLAIRAVDVPTTKPYSEGVATGLEGCDQCELIPVEITTADFGAGVQQKLSQALVQHPDANVVLIPADALLTGGVEAALRSTGRFDEIFLALGEGDPAAMDALRQGKINGAGIGIPEDWEGYASIDNLNRLFAGEEPATSSGIGLQAFDADHNLPSTGGYQAPIDFKAAYLESWNR